MTNDLHHCIYDISLRHDRCATALAAEPCFSRDSEPQQKSPDCLQPDSEAIACEANGCVAYASGHSATRGRLRQDVLERPTDHGHVR